MATGFEVSRRLRRFYRKQSRKAQLYSVLNLALSIASIILYVAWTVRRRLDKIIRRIDYSLSVYFVVVFVGEFCASHDKLFHARRWMTWGDFISLVPILRNWDNANSNNLGEVLQTFRAFRILRLNRILSFYPPGSKRRIWEAFILITSVLFLMTSIIYELANHNPTRFGKGLGEFTFLEAFYYIVVTTTTVGYGDFSPSQQLSRLIMALVIPPMIVVVPVTFNRVFTEVSSWQQYAHPVKIAASRSSPSIVLRIYSNILKWRQERSWWCLFLFNDENHPQYLIEEQQNLALYGSSSGAEKIFGSNSSTTSWISTLSSPTNSPKSPTSPTSKIRMSPQAIEKAKENEATMQRRRTWLTKRSPHIQRIKRRRALSRQQRLYEEEQLAAWHHVVITGNMFSGNENSIGRQLPVMLEHCFLSDRESRYLQLVILNPRDPSKIVEKCVLEHPYYNQRCAWVTGSPYESLHVENWAHAQTAMAVVVLGDGTAPYTDFQAEDERTVRQTIAITRMLHATANKSAKVKSRLNITSSSFTAAVAATRNDEYINNNSMTLKEVECMRRMHIPRPPRVVGCLLRERNEYLLEAEAEAGITVLALDSIKYALLARSLSAPMVHLLLTSLVCKRPHRRLIVDDAKLTPFDAGCEIDSSRPQSSQTFARRQSFQRLPSVSSLDRGEFVTREAARRLQSNNTAGTGSANNSLRDENRPQSVPQQGVKFSQNSPVRRRFFFQPPLKADNQQPTELPEVATADTELRPISCTDDEEQQQTDAVSLVPSEEEDELPSHDDEHQEQMERDLSASYGLHEVKTTLNMVGITFGALATAAHEAIKTVASKHTDDGPHLATVLGALPVAVILGDSATSRRRVLNFPSMYKLEFGDALLVIARTYSDAVAVLDHVDFVALYEDARHRRRRSPTLPLGRLPKSALSSNDRDTSCRDGLAGHAAAAMQQVAEVGMRPAKKRKAYMTAWAKRHVVNEVPRGLCNHVVLCAPADHAPYFLQPLLVAKELGNQAIAEPPDVVILDNMNSDEEPDLSRKYMRVLEDLVFYDPLPLDFDPEREEFNDMNQVFTEQRLWIVIGDPLERPRRVRPSGFPSTLERAGVERCSHFVLPNVSTTFRDDAYDEGFVDDNYNSKVARNVDALTSAHAAKAAAAVACLPRRGRRRSYVFGRQHRPPRVLVEVEEVAKVRDFLTVQSYNHEHNPENLIVGAFGEAASRDTRCEVFSPRILHALPVVIACDSDAILYFTKHAVCCFSRSGELPTVDLDNGQTFESCCLICHTIPDKFHDHDYSSFLNHCVLHGCLPIALCRKSVKSHTDSTNCLARSRSSVHDLASDDENKSEASLHETKSESSPVAFRGSKYHVPSVLSIYNRIAHSDSLPHLHEGEHHDVVEDDSHQPFYIYVNPLPGDAIRRHDKAYLLVNSQTMLEDWTDQAS